MGKHGGNEVVLWVNDANTREAKGTNNDCLENINDSRTLCVTIRRKHIVCWTYNEKSSIR